MSRPLNRQCNLPELGKVDRKAGEFWVSNPFLMPEEGHNLSAYERNCLYINHEGSEFLDASFASDVELDADSRSAMVGDFNRDGASDLLVASVGGGPLRLFLNQSPSLGNAVRLNLVGTTSNRMAVGTRVMAVVDGRRIVRDLFAANGCLGAGPVELLIGLGNADRISSLEIRWPSGQTQQFDNIPEAAELTVTEGSPDIVAGQSEEPGQE